MTMPDPQWFNAHPRRRHRVRPISLAEIEQGLPLAPDGCARLPVIRRVAALELMTIFTVDCSSIDHAALDEAAAYEFFEFALSMLPPHLHTQLRG